MNWKSRDMAICVNVDRLNGHPGQLPPLRLKLEYLVHKVYVCECGSVKLDVGLSTDTGVECKCGASSSPSSGIWWVNAVRFVKKDQRTKQEQIEEAINNEDFELATKLRDQ